MLNRQNLGILTFLPRVYYGIKDIFLQENRIAVMMFHHIERTEFLHFQALMQFVHENYQVITPEEFEQCLAGNKLQGNFLKVLLSFDDGFQSDYFVAREILDKFGMQAVHFISPDFINCQTVEDIRNFVEQRLLLDSSSMQDFLPMSWEQIASLQQGGHRIGAHTYTHFCCKENSVDLLQKEICGSGDYLSSKLGIAINWFAFPFGNIHSLCPTAVRLAQGRYEYIFSTVRGYNTCSQNSLLLYREAVAMQDDVNYVRFMLEGGLMPYYRQARKALHRMAK